MIAEENIELVSKKDLTKYILDYVENFHNNKTIETSLTVAEIFALIHGAPKAQNEAEWLCLESKNSWYCSWCTMSVLRDDSGALVRTKYCPRCGRRMRR